MKEWNFHHWTPLQILSSHSFPLKSHHVLSGFLGFYSFKTVSFAELRCNSISTYQCDEQQSNTEQTDQSHKTHKRTHTQEGEKGTPGIWVCASKSRKWCPKINNYLSLCISSIVSFHLSLLCHLQIISTHILIGNIYCTYHELPGTVGHLFIALLLSLFLTILNHEVATSSWLNGWETRVWKNEIMFSDPLVCNWFLSNYCSEEKREENKC